MSAQPSEVRMNAAQQAVARSMTPEQWSLVDAGPLVNVVIEGPAKTIEGRAIIDTGCGFSGVDARVAREAGLRERGGSWVAAACDCGRRVVSCYEVVLRIAGHEPIALDGVREFPLAHFVEHPIIAVLGRDVLSRYVLVYDGVSGKFQLRAAEERA